MLASVIVLVCLTIIVGVLLWAAVSTEAGRISEVRKRVIAEADRDAALAKLAAAKQKAAELFE